MDFFRLENAICDINKLHKEISREYLIDNSFNLRKIRVKDVVENSSKISKEFLDYIDKYYAGLNAALISSNFEYDYSEWDARIRIKQKESVINKLHYYFCNHVNGKTSIQKCLNDLLGFRLIIDDFNFNSLDIQNFFEDIKCEQNLMKWYTRDKEGYKGTHIYFKNVSNFYFPWELQIWNTAYARSNEISHELHKAKRNYIMWPEQYKTASLKEEE